MTEIIISISTITGLSGLILVLLADPQREKYRNVYWISGFMLLITSILLLIITLFITM